MSQLSRAQLCMMQAHVNSVDGLSVCSTRIKASGFCCLVTDVAADCGTMTRLHIYCTCNNVCGLWYSVVFCMSLSVHSVAMNHDSDLMSV